MTSSELVRNMIRDLTWRHRSAPKGPKEKKP